MDFLRIYLIGERGVGKSALVVRYLTKRFLIDCSQDTGKEISGFNIKVIDFCFLISTVENRFFLPFLCRNSVRNQT